MAITRDSLTAVVPPGGTMNAYNNSGSDIAGAVFVRRSGTAKNQCALPSAATDPCWGVTPENGIKNGHTAAIQTAGIAIATLAATLSAGAEVTVNSDGHLVAWNPAAGTNHAKVGVLNTGGVDNDLAEIILSPPFTLQQG